MRPDEAGAVKAAEEGSFDGLEDNDDEEELGRPWIGGFQDQAHLALFVLPLGSLWASGAGGSCYGVPQVAAVVFHGFPLILESSQFL
jgi:hypothetical protein